MPDTREAVAAHIEALSPLAADELAERLVIGTGLSPFEQRYRSQLLVAAQRRVSGAAGDNLHPTSAIGTFDATNLESASKANDVNNASLADAKARLAEAERVSNDKLAGLLKAAIADVESRQKGDEERLTKGLEAGHKKYLDDIVAGAEADNRRVTTWQDTLADHYQRLGWSPEDAKQMAGIRTAN